MSGAGFGSALWNQEKVHYQAGVHYRNLSKELSNFYQAKNLLLRIKELTTGGLLDKMEVFIIMDNLPFKVTFFKGHSPSPKLNQIIFHLQQVQQQGSSILHMIKCCG